MNYFKFLIVITSLFAMSFASNSNTNIISSAQSIATVSPIAHSLTQALLKGTNIRVAFIPPKRLPINRIASWIKKNENEPQNQYDVFVTISSVRIDLDFYKTLRSANIKIIPIDIAQALIPSGEKVALEHTDEAFWLNINNALIMFGILKRDITTLWPEHKEQINKNYLHLSQTLRSISLEFDQTILENNFDAILTHSNTSAFAKSLILPIILAEETQFFNTLIISNKKQPNTWVIDDFTKYSDTHFIQRWQNNVKALQTITVN